MATLLGLDLGTQRTGLAISRDGWVSEYATLGTAHDLPHALAKIVQEEGISRLVVGLPRNVDGTEGFQAAWVRRQALTIGETTGRPIDFVDEVLTTAEAARQLSESGVAPNERAERIDQTAARLILEQYLDSQPEGR